MPVKYVIKLVTYISGAFINDTAFLESNIVTQGKLWKCHIFFSLLGIGTKEITWGKIMYAKIFITALSIIEWNWKWPKYQNKKRMSKLQCTKVTFWRSHTKKNRKIIVREQTSFYYDHNIVII